MNMKKKILFSLVLILATTIAQAQYLFRNIKLTDPVGLTMLPSAEPVVGEAGSFYVSTENILYISDGLVWTPIGVADTPTFQQVTTEGATTDQAVTINNEFSTYANSGSTALQVGNDYVQITTSGIAISAGEDYYSSFNNDGTAEIGQRDITFGEGLSGDLKFKLLNGDANSPELRYNDTADKWQFSNDGLIFTDFSEGAVPTLQEVTEEGATTDQAMVLSGGITSTATTNDSSEKFGSGSLASYSGVYGDNTAFGTNSLTTLTTGVNNTAFGSESLYLNNGQQNVAVGYNSLRNNTGDFNTAVGTVALWVNTIGDNNTATGYNSLVNNATGSYNTSNGARSLRDNLGSNNTAVGYNSGLEQEGSDNVFIGYNSAVGSDGDNFNNMIVIGASAVGRGSNTLQLGNSLITDIYTDATYNTTGDVHADGTATASNVWPVFYQTLTGTTPSHNTTTTVNTKITLTGNTTLTLTNLVNGMSGNIKVYQDATGGHTITISPTPDVINGGGGVITLTGTALSKDILSWTYDGTELDFTYGLNYN